MSDDTEIERLEKSASRNDVQRIKVQRDNALLDMEKLMNERDALVRALDDLQSAETIYRMCHDLDGDGHINTGRAWNKLRQAGQRARAALSQGNASCGTGRGSLYE
ncbi:hypothetical protein [uncultured Bradyrhizobium sp.]|uniref:hypothetical protein n=1 Tax=uncultured Bradyrhizobium sp. TaxID=199684 RepID=UPI0035CB852A